MSQKYSVSEFVNIIKSLCLGSHIWLHQKYSTKDTEYVQLSAKVSIAYHKLKSSVRPEEFKFLNPEEALKNFIQKLVSSARLNHWYYPNAEKAHAEYLVGFLLQQSFIIEHKGASYNLNKMILESLPCMEREYQPTYYFFQEHLMPRIPHDFLSKPWREKQEYPSLQDLHNTWSQYIQEKQQKKEQKELKEKQQALKEQQEQQVYALWRRTHFFDGTVLDYKNFSFVLEGIVKFGHIKLWDNSMLGRGAELSATLSQQLLSFSQQVRNTQLTSDNNMKLAFEFEQLMRGLIYSSKYDRSQNGDAARQLVGFFLFHDFCIQHGVNQIRMQDIFWNEANDMEKCHIANGSEYHPWRFLDDDWQQKQNYPGKKDLENMLFSEQQNMINDAPNRMFLNAFQNQAVNTGFSGQGYINDSNPIFSGKGAVFTR